MDHRLPVSTSTVRALPGATAPAGERAELVPVHADLTMEGSTFIHIDPQSHALTWCIRSSDSQQKDDVVRPNDFVIISSPDGEELFKGDINSIFFVSDPLGVYHEIGGRQPPPSGFKIYWAPEGVDPYRWTSLFNAENLIHLHRHTTALLPAT